MATSSNIPSTASADKRVTPAQMRGFVFPFPTVFDGKGEVDDACMIDLLDWYIDCGIDGLMPLGSFGQGPACRMDQRKHVAELIVRRVAGRMPVIIHVGTVDPYSAIELGLHAKAIGADGIAIVGPYYYSDHSEWEIIEHFRMIDAAVNLPVLLYINDAYSGYPIGPALAKRIANEVPNVFSVKLAAGDTGVIQRYADTLGDEVAVFSGSINVVPGMDLGARGFINPPIALTPELGIDLLRAFDAGEVKEALELQERVARFQSATGKLRKYGRGVTRAGWNLRGFDVKEFPRWPTPPMAEEDVAYLKSCFREALGDRFTAR